MRRRGRRRATPTASSAPSSSSARCSAPSALAIRAMVRKPSSTASGRALRSSTSSRLASRAPASSGWLRSQTAAASTRGQHAGERAAPAEVALGAGQRRPQQVLGQQHLAFPQVGQADDEVAPAVEVAVAPRRGRRAAPAAGAAAPAPAGRRAGCGRPSGWRAPAAAADPPAAGPAAPGVVQLGEAVGIVGVDRGAALDQRAFAAQRRIDARAEQDALDEAVRLLVARAQGQRPGRGQQQARPAVDLVRRQPRQPFEHGALAPVRHQRFVEAAFGQVVGGLAAGRRRARAAPPPRPGPSPARPSAARPCSAACSSAGRPAKRCCSSSRARACMRSHSPASLATKTGVSRGQPRQPLGGVCGARDARGRARDAAGRGWRCGSGSRRRPDRGWPAAGRRSGRAARRCCSAITERSKRGSLPAAIAESASCRPSGQPSVELVQARRRVAVDPAAEAGPHQLDRLLEAEAQLRRADDDAVAVGDQVVDLEAAVGPRRRPPRAGWTARCAAGRPGPRASPAAGGRPRRR